MKSIELTPDTHLLISIIFLVLAVYCLIMLPNPILQFKLLILGIIFGVIFAELWILTLRRNPKF